MPHVFDRRDYVRYGFGRNNYYDSGDRVARATRVKRGLDKAFTGLSAPFLVCPWNCYGVAKIAQPGPRWFCHTASYDNSHDPGIS